MNSIPENGNYPWGSQLPAVPGMTDHTYVRTSYKYRTHGRQRIDELARKVVLVDNLQEREIVPHRRGNAKPQGVGVLFGDGRANFCTGDDIFDEQLWPREPGWYNGPGDNRPVFDEILRRIELGHQKRRPSRTLRYVPPPGMVRNRKNDEKRDMTRILASMIVLCPLLIGGSTRCPEPNYPDVEDCPFVVDPNLIVGQLLGWVRLEVGQNLTHTRTWCDPEGDPAAAEIVAGPEGVRLVNKPRVSSYTLLWTPRQPMIAAIVVRVTDKPSDAQPKSSTGTILVQVVPRGQRLAPKGCGAPPR